MRSTTSELQQSRGVIEHYREYLPVSASTPIVSLGEGNTPLIYCAQLSKRVGRDCKVFVKNEGVNPTGSFKDRGMTMPCRKRWSAAQRLSFALPPATLRLRRLLTPHAREFRA